MRRGMVVGADEGGAVGERFDFDFDLDFLRERWARRLGIRLIRDESMVGGCWVVKLGSVLFCSVEMAGCVVCVSGKGDREIRVLVGGGWMDGVWWLMMGKMGS
jgi:hypothetical protein